MTLSKPIIEQQLQQNQDPYLGQDLVSAKAIKAISIENGKVSLKISLGYPADNTSAELIHNVRSTLMKLDGVQDVEVEVTWKIVSHEVQTGLKGIPNVKNIIAVASGKGGVGKSTVTVNLALALAKEGVRVGILDADIYGPNQPQMLGAQDKPHMCDDKKLEPVVCHGVQSMSIGYLIDTTTPMVWRGPMVSSALQQLLNNTVWDNLDYLFIDMPPGTGDIQLTLAQKVPVSGAIIVTTPQDIALLDARKGLEMFRKVKVPVLGVIENMSTHFCTQCGHEEPIFGTAGGKKMATDCNVPLLGQLPLAMEIRAGVDEGCPTVAADANNPLALQFRNIARKVAAQLSIQSLNYATKFPNIVIE